MAHKHAKKMMEYAKDAAKYDRPWDMWECSIIGLDLWEGCIVDPDWSGVLNYRRKQQYIMVNGHKVPEPVSHVDMGQSYYYPSLGSLEFYDSAIWGDDSYDKGLMARRLVHLSEENAAAHGMALVSFTQKEGK